MRPGPSLAAAVLAVDPAGMGGVLLRGPAGPARDAWVATLRRLLPAGTPWRRLPPHVNDAALLGGLDLGATLSAGRAVASAGLVAQAHGGVLIAPMAERMDAALAGKLGAFLDTGELVLEREGLAARQPARFALVALDEGVDDERAPGGLADRLALHLAPGEESAGGPGAGAFDAADGGHTDDALFSAADVAAARERLGRLPAQPELLEALCAAALALGVDSMRAPLLAWRCARALAALAGDDKVQHDHAAVAAAWVLAPRATRIPAPAEEDAQPPAPPESQAEPDPAQPPDAPRADAPQDEDPPPDPDPDPGQATQALLDQVIEAARAALPAGLLASVAIGAARERAGSAGRAGAEQKSRTRGRPIGARPGDPNAGARLHLVETLRAAAPWQVLRRRELEARGQVPVAPVQVRREDFRVRRHAQRRRTTTIFAVDASGSSALHRLAEAKGAVELLLADCYVRRDEVAVIAFRGSAAQVLLPPTRSLARARRSLAGLPGGGGTPLASAIDMACALADGVRRRGDTPLVVLLTDGRANIARDGSPGRERAGQEALDAARQLAARRHPVLLLDTSPHAHPVAEALAAALQARYIPLPHAQAHQVCDTVRRLA